MNWHPVVTKFPLIRDLDPKGWEDFKADIKATKGNTKPIEFRLVDGQMQGLDGRNRFVACKELGIKPKLKKISLPDAAVLDYVIRANLHRRHQGAERLTLVAALRSEGQSTREIGEKLGVSPGTVNRDLQVLRGATPDVEKVTGKDGKLYPATKTTPGDADESPVLCGRCKRVGAAKNCDACRKLQEKMAQRRTRKPPSKSGKPLIDWKEFEKHFGPVMRLPEQIAKAYPDEKKQWEYTEASKLMDKLAELLKEWKTRLLKVKP